MARSEKSEASRVVSSCGPVSVSYTHLLLGEARQKKVDEAIQILQMLRLLPLLKESGVFSGLLSGLL